jgi:hypothetical protein
MKLRIRVVDPPAGVQLRMQRGRDELIEPIKVTKVAVIFEFDVRVASRTGGLANFLGDFTQGPPGARFVYINSGTLAGQAGSPWTRRAKVPLTGITMKQIEQAETSGKTLTAEIEGAGRNGGPPAGTVDLIGDAWKLE